MEDKRSNHTEAMSISDCNPVTCTSSATPDHDHLSQYCHGGRSDNAKAALDRVSNELSFQWLMSKLTFHGATCFLACLSHIPENFPQRSHYVRKIVNCCHLSINIHYAKVNLISSDLECLELIKFVSKSTLLNDNITFNIQPHLWKVHDYLNENVLSFATANVSACSILDCDGELGDGLISKVIIFALTGPLPSLKSTLQCKKCGALYDIDKYYMSNGSVLRYESNLKTGLTEVSPSTYFTKEVLHLLGETENDCSMSSDVLMEMYQSLVGGTHSWPACCRPKATPVVLHHPKKISAVLHHPEKILHHPAKISAVLHHPAKILHHPEKILHHPEKISVRLDPVTKESKRSVNAHDEDRVPSGNTTDTDHACDQSPHNITGDDDGDNSKDTDSGTDTGYYIPLGCISARNDQSNAKAPYEMKTTVFPKCISVKNNQSNANIQHTWKRSTSTQINQKCARNKHECITCGKVFKKNCLLQRHNRIHTKDRPYICELCGHAFGQKGGLDAHLRTHTGIRPFKCAECGKTFAQKGNLDYHMGTHQGEKPYLCSSCGKSFAGKSAFQLHLETHTGLRPFNCTLCPKSFVREGLLKQHMQSHSGIRPYQCSECGKSFFRRCHLFRHERIHSGLRPYLCKECGQTFTQCEHLKSHLRTHSGDRPFPCQICGKTFTQPGNLSVHMKSHDKHEAQASSIWNTHLNVVSVKNDVDPDIHSADKSF